MEGSGSVIIVGDDGVPVRVREELEGAGVPTVSVCSSLTTVAARAAQAAGATVLVGDAGSTATWREAGLATARSVGLLSSSDLPNLNAGLLVAELRDDVTIVVRLVSSDMAEGVGRLLGGNATVLSEIEVAAPAFLQAALSGNTGQKVTVANHVLEVREVDPDHPGLVVALCNADTPTEVLPTRAQTGPLILGLVDTAGVVAGARGALPPSIAARQLARAEASSNARRKKPRASRRSRAWAALQLVPGRAWALLGTIAAVVGTGTTVFALSDHLDLVDSLYFTVTTMATVGYGDVKLIGAPNWLKLFDIGLMGVSALLVASVLAFVTDMLVSSRIDRALGRFPRPRQDHVIVCGLGKAGAKIIAGLHELDIPCIGVEQSPEALGVSVARALEIPVVFADARAAGTLDDLRVSHARAVMAVTTDDLANLQVGITAREHNPDLRVVLRIFDPRLAERLDRSIELDLTRSVSALAAPAFTAALLGRPLAQALPLSNVPLRVLEVEVPASSRFAGRAIRELHHEGELRVLAVDGRWRPRDDQPVAAGTTIAVVGTREACDDLLNAEAA